MRLGVLPHIQSHYFSDAARAFAHDLQANRIYAVQVVANRRNTCWEYFSPLLTSNAGLLVNTSGWSGCQFLRNALQCILPIIMREVSEWRRSRRAHPRRLLQAHWSL